MAGSYQHVIDVNGEFIGDRFTQMIENLGDAWEACEEMHFMIGYLAGKDRSKIFEAHRAYVATFNPEYAAKMTEEGYWKD